MEVDGELDFDVGGRWAGGVQKTPETYTGTVSSARSWSRSVSKLFLQKKKRKQVVYTNLLSSNLMLYSRHVPTYVS